MLSLDTLLGCHFLLLYSLMASWIFSLRLGLSFGTTVPAVLCGTVDSGLGSGSSLNTGHARCKRPFRANANRWSPEISSSTFSQASKTVPFPTADNNISPGRLLWCVQTHACYEKARRTTWPSLPGTRCHPAFRDSP